MGKAEMAVAHYSKSLLAKRDIKVPCAHTLFSNAHPRSLLMCTHSVSVSATALPQNCTPPRQARTQRSFLLALWTCTRVSAIHARSVSEANHRQPS
eukprot:2415623-Rhodomonas_salina.1